MPKKNDAQVPSKNKTIMPTIPIFKLFLTLKKYHASK